MTTTRKIKLPEVTRHLRDDFGVSVSYRRLYTAVLDGIVPAEKDASGIVVEAAIKSGTMETAKYCCEQGRLLYSVNPGILGDDGDHSGNRKLIEDGAMVLENKDDVLRLIRGIGN